MDESLFSDRLADLEILLPNVRFPLISLAVLHELQTSCLTRTIRVLLELVVEAQEYVSHGSDLVTSSNALPTVDSKHGRLVRFCRSTLRFTPRPSAYKELQYICDGDRNGVFYHIGTLYGRHSWMNPVLTKRMVVSASSPPSRFTDMKEIVSRKYQTHRLLGHARQMAASLPGGKQILDTIISLCVIIIQFARMVPPTSCVRGVYRGPTMTIIGQKFLVVKMTELYVEQGSGPCMEPLQTFLSVISELF